MTLSNDLLASLGEFVGTTMFLFLSFGGAKTALRSRSFTLSDDGDGLSIDNQTIICIALSFGMGLLVTAWVFYRVSGAVFNPAITFALWLIGGLTLFRATLLTIAQILGGIAASALVSGLTPYGGTEMLLITLGGGTNVAQGLFLEAFLTSTLVLTVLLLAAEKHKSTFLAPIGIGLVLLSCHLFGIPWTGCGMNPARAFGPSVIAGAFPSYHWIYWLGPMLGSLMAVAFYLLLKVCDYTLIVAGQDADHEDPESQRHAVGAALVRQAVGKVVVFHPKQEEAKEKADGEMDSEISALPTPSRIIAFDPTNDAVKMALREGQATVVDLAMSPPKTDQVIFDEDGAIAAAAGSTLYGGRGSKFSMKSQRQNTGAMQPPGTESSGLANLPIAKAIIQSGAT